MNLIKIKEEYMKVFCGRRGRIILKLYYIPVNERKVLQMKWEVHVKCVT